MNYAYEPRSAWEIFEDKKDEMREFASTYIEFLTKCKTERETVAFAYKTLADAGFVNDFASDKILVPFREKSLFAVRRGKFSLEQGLNLIAAHVDSPRLDFKQHPFIEQAGLAQAKTHYYGGIRKYQWLARPLALHGVLIQEDGNKINVSIGEEEGEPVFCIADLLPHLSKKQDGQKVSEAFDGEKLNIILSHEPALGIAENKEAVKTQLLNYLHEKYDVKEEDFITAELEAVPAGKARFVGFDKSMVGAYGQDDRICVFCALQALLNASPAPNHTQAIILWDKEEIGSDGATGASSRFFQYCLQDLKNNWEKQAAISRIFLNTWALSADVTAAFDPDYPEVHEKQNAAKLGYGPAFSKFTGSRGKYGASEADAEFFAALRHLLNSRAIPWQASELGKIDIGGGGTVALFLAALGLNVIDLGPALLSMHSPFEISSVADLYATYEAYKSFLSGNRD